MMTLALKLLTSKLAGPIAASVAALLALALGWQTFQLSMTRGALKRSVEKVERVEKDLRTCQDNVEELDAARKRQNAALEAKSAEDARRLAEAGKQLHEAVKGRDKAEARAAKLLSSPPVGVDACARAMDAFETVKAGAR